MCRGHFEASCTKFYIHVVILDDRYLPVDEGHYHFLATKVLVLGVVGIYAHGSISHDGFRSCSSHYGIRILAYHFISEVIQLAVFLLIYYLYVAQSGFGFGVPVHHALASVDKSFVIKVDKHTDYALVTDVIHRKRGTAPVT